MSVNALLCTSCGANLEPRILEAKVKCNYCGTVFVIERDHEGVKGVTLEGAAPPGAGAAAATGAPPSPAAPLGGIDPQTIARLEKDALLVVRGLEAAEETAFAARGIARAGTCGCLGVVLVGLVLAGVAAVVLA